MERPNDDEIRRRAYELYESRGEAQGSDMDDWLAAEREVRERSSAAGAEPDTGTSTTRGDSAGRPSTRGPTTRGSSARGPGTRGGARRGPVNGPDSPL